MADTLTDFILDDSEDDGGAFNDLPPTPKDKDPEKPPEPEPKLPEKAPSEPQEPVEPPKSPEPKTQPTGYEKQLAAQQAQLTAMTQAIRGMQEQNKPPAEPEAIKIEYPSEDDWLNDPEKAAEKLAQATQAQARHEADIRIQADREERQRAEQLRSTQHSAYGQALQVLPELNDANADPQIRQAYNQVLNDPNLGLANHPQGPLFAALVLDRAKQMHNAANPPAPPEADQSRQVRVKQNVIQANTPPHKPSDGSATLRPEERAECRRAGITEAAYLDAKKSMGLS